MDIDVCIQRLKNTCPSLQGRVFGAAELSDEDTQTVLTPSVFVLPLSDKCADTPGRHPDGQRIDEEFGITIEVSNLSDALGAGAYAEFQAVRAEIKTALQRWKPMGDDFTIQPVWRVQGKLATYKNRVLAWNEIYRHSYWEQD